MLPNGPQFISHDPADPLQKAVAEDELNELEQSQAIKQLFRVRGKSSIYKALKQNPRLRDCLGGAAAANLILSVLLGLWLLWLLTGLGTNDNVKLTSSTAYAPFAAVGIDFRMALRLPRIISSLVGCKTASPHYARSHQVLSNQKSRPKPSIAHSQRQHASQDMRAGC
jgi:hypothetical protein